MSVIQVKFTCRNCGGGDSCRVAIYRPFGEVSLSLNRTVTCMVLKANDRRTSCPCHDEFRGPHSDYVRQFTSFQVLYPEILTQFCLSLSSVPLNISLIGPCRMNSNPFLPNYPGNPQQDSYKNYMKYLAYTDVNTETRTIPVSYRTEEQTWTTERKNILFTDEFHLCRLHEVGRFTFGDTVELNSCVMHHLNGPTPGVMARGGIGFHYPNPLVRIASTLNNQRYITEVWEPLIFPFIQR
ncbi:uncharacterized protein TNCV_1953681 [Trichonephila clavipes]|nr:uncharacterized protein TNCV_1953681 [Trichonephila clavipes]